MRALLAVCCLSWVSPARAQECATPGSDWVFCDDFESGIDSAWQEVSNVDLTSTEVYGGAQGIAITSHKGVDTGGGMKLDMAPGYETLHLRFYVKLSANFGYMHHFVQLAGRGTGRPLWFPFGSAGCLPSGSNFFTSGLEIDGLFYGGSTPNLGIPGRWTFYTYYMDMTGWGTGTQTCIDTCADCTDNRDSPNCNDTCYHGNAFAPTPDQIPSLDTWYCMEMQITVNDLGSANGTQTM